MENLIGLFYSSVNEVPAITALNFSGGLTYGVGLSTGQILLYDIRANKPFLMKDHMYGWPVRNIEFLGDNVLSMDMSIVKIWNKETVIGIIFHNGEFVKYFNHCLFIFFLSKLG